MGSKLLPQALLTLPRSICQFPPNNVVFSASISRRAFSNSTTRVAISYASHNPPAATAPIKRCSSFVVRADANSEAEADSSGNAEEKEENAAEEKGEIKAEAEGETEAEEGLGSEQKVEEVKKERKPRIKLGEIMGILNKKAIEASEEVRPVPDIRTGDIVEIKLEVPENRRRLSVYKGIVISKQNAGIHTTIRIRRIIAGIGVEIVFPVYSPNIKELKVVAHRKVRRARLYYLRDKLPRLSTFK